MAKIICPNEEYTGVSAGVAFANGRGETKDKYLIEWFKEHGYEVEEEQQPKKFTKDELEKMQYNDLRKLAADFELNTNSMKKNEIIEELLKVEVGE